MEAKSQSQLSIRVEAELRQQLERLAREEGKVFDPPRSAG
jgi:hypothetical protein